MPRESAVVRVPEFPGTRNRDKGKIFKITEWSAAEAERWGLRATFALGSSNEGRLPLDLAGGGMETIAIIGINAFLSATRGMGDNFVTSVVIPLLDELLKDIEIVRDHSRPDVLTKLNPDVDLEEIATRMWLRGEVLSLHLGFSVGAALSALYGKIMSPRPSPELQPQPTSHPESPPSSEAASRRSRSSKASTV